MEKNLSEWKAEVAKDYGTLAFYVVPSTSFASWGAINTGRHLFARVKSPFGGHYNVYSRYTAKERADLIEQAREKSLRFDDQSILDTAMAIL